MEREKRPPLFERLKRALEEVSAFERGEKVLRVWEVTLSPPPRDHGLEPQQTE